MEDDAQRPRRGSSVGVFTGVLKTSPVLNLPEPPAAPAPLGLIAGGGRLPLLVARGMRQLGHPVHAIGLRGFYEPQLPSLCDSFNPVGVLRINSWSRMLRRHGITHAVMVGRVDKASMAYDWRGIISSVPDLRTIRVWFGLRKDRRSHRILGAIAHELAHDGVQLIDSTAHIPDQMAVNGVMTQHRPTTRQQADIDFGWPILREMLRLDIGQSIAVHGGDVIAVEAVEGTDRMIERAGGLCRDGSWTLLKAARYGHDRRADVPTIGPNTITNLHRAGGRCIAIASGDVIVIDKADTLALADKLGIAIIGIKAE